MHFWESKCTKKWTNHVETIKHGKGIIISEKVSKNPNFFNDRDKESGLFTCNRNRDSMSDIDYYSRFFQDFRKC